MHALSVLLNMCEGMTNRVLIDDGARWILQGEGQERENQTTGVNALHSAQVSTTSGREVRHATRQNRGGAMLRVGSFDRSGASPRLHEEWRKHHEAVLSNADRIRAV